MATTLDQLLYGIREQETGGMSESQRYHVINSIGAVGAYQVMTANIASWTKAALGKSLTRDQFRNSKSAQDKVARYIIGGYYKKYGAEGAAAMWYSGQPDPTKTYGNPPVYRYVDEVIQKAKGGTISGGAASGGPVGGGGGGSTEQTGFSIPGLSDIAKFFGDATDSLEAVSKFFIAFIYPSTWIRIGCGIFGFAFLIVSIICFAREARIA